MIVYDSQGRSINIDTSKELGSGGEGIIYKMGNQVAKIYHSHIQPAMNMQFVNEISKLNGQFVKPVDIYYNKSKRVVGFSMPYMDMGKLKPFYDLFSKTVCNQENINTDFKIRVLESLAEGLNDAHSKDVVIGDLNPYNLLFDSRSAKVYFIDTDSYQTTSRPHSGIMLPDIRDWLTHKIDKNSDYYSYSVLAFNNFTFVHPFKGVHPKYKTIEERVLNKLSLLSGNKDIKIPSFYEPISETNVSNQFYQVFQEGKRFLVDVNKTNTTKVSVPLVTTTLLKSLSVKDIQHNVSFFVIQKNKMKVVSKSNVISWYDVDKHMTVSPGNSPVYVKPLFEQASIQIDDYIVSFTEDTYTIQDLNGYQLVKLNIFFPSLKRADNVIIQSISGKKWLLYPERTGLTTVRTEEDIRDAVRRGEYYCLKIKVNNRIKTYLAKQEGLKIKLGVELGDMRKFCVIGDNVFIPEDGRIDVYSFMHKVAEIECKFVTENSILSSCGAGIICQTDDKLMLINKI